MTAAAATATTATADAEATRAMAQALYEALLPAAEQCTREMNAVSAAQDQLALKIDQLTAELERLSQMSHSVGLTAYTRRILAARTRLNAVMATLAAAEHRIARMTSEMKAKSATAAPLLEEVTEPPAAPAEEAEPEAKEAAPAAEAKEEAPAPAEAAPEAEAPAAEAEEKKEDKETEKEAAAQ